MNVQRVLSAFKMSDLSSLPQQAFDRVCSGADVSNIELGGRTPVEHVGPEAFHNLSDVCGKWLRVHSLSFTNLRGLRHLSEARADPQSSGQEFASLTADVQAGFSEAKAQAAVTVEDKNPSVFMVSGSTLFVDTLVVLDRSRTPPVAY